MWVSQSNDPTKGFSTIAGATLLTSDAVVDLTVYDPNGNAIGNATFSGGVGEEEVALSALVQSDLPIGRVRFDVISGLAAPFAVMVDNVTGDPMGVPVDPPATASTDIVFPNLVKATESEAQTWRSDLRLISAGTAVINVTVASSSTAALTGTTHSITVNPGQIVEMQDVLGSLLSAADGATATLEFQSLSAVTILARTVFVYTNGTAGTFGYLETANPVSGYLAPGETATLIGLKQDKSAPGAVSTIGVATGADGFTADIALSDVTGKVLATIPSGLSVHPSTTSEIAIGTLFQNVSIPDDARLDVAPQSGQALVYAKNEDLKTKDIDQVAASVLEPYSCPAPSVISFAAVPSTLTAGGSIEMDWFVSGAISVQIDSGVGGGGESGSVTVQVGQSTTYNLTAQNGCGTATASVVVPVGPPTLSAVTPNNLMPGQTATLSISNAADLTTAQSALLTCGSASPQPVPLNVDASGNVTLVVPFVSDSSFPDGYWDGSCTLTAQVDNRQTAPLSFTISALAYAGGPLAAFKTLVANIQQEAHAQFAAQAGTNAFGQVASALNPLVDQWAAQFSQMVSDIAANGMATLPLDVPVPGGRLHLLLQLPLTT
jgi:hypothetical protein